MERERVVVVVAVVAVAVVVIRTQPIYTRSLGGGQRGSSPANDTPDGLLHLLAVDEMGEHYTHH